MDRILKLFIEKLNKNLKIVMFNLGNSIIIIVVSHYHSCGRSFDLIFVKMKESVTRYGLYSIYLTLYIPSFLCS